MKNAFRAGKYLFTFSALYLTDAVLRHNSMITSGLVKSEKFFAVPAPTVDCASASSWQRLGPKIVGCARQPQSGQPLRWPVPFKNLLQNSWLQVHPALILRLNTPGPHGTGLFIRSRRRRNFLAIHKILPLLRIGDDRY